MQAAERALRTLSAGNRALLRARSERELLHEMCRVIVEVGGYSMAWVGYVHGEDRALLRAMAHFERKTDPALPQPAIFSLSEFDQQGTFSGIAIATGRPSVRHSVATSPEVAEHWREDMMKRGYASCSAFPLAADGAIIGSLSIMAGERDAFGQDEVEVLAELAEDLGFGIATHRGRERQKAAEEAVHRMAYFDTLTGLPNRARFVERVAGALEQARAERCSLAVVTLNVDRFRDINEVVGYAEGDEVLKELAARLKLASPLPDSVARIGGDEFVFLLRRATAEQASEFARHLLSLLDEPFNLASIRIDLQASAGVALYPGHGVDPYALIAHAEAAMYAAKRAHAGVAMYNGEAERDKLRRLSIMGELRRAIEDDQLRLFCQPKIDLRTGAVCGAEALVRWRHSELGELSPEEFVPLAERTGLINPLTYWVLNASLGQCYAWRETGVIVPLAVNLSARNLQDPRFVERVEGLVATWGAVPEWLHFELTESALIEDSLHALEVLGRLRGLGAKLFIDDFGTGHSSLSYLKKLPIDAIKIDKSFVQGMSADRDSAAIVRSTIELAHNLGLEVVAEGVETAEVWQRLIELGCDCAQGTYVSEPFPIEQFGWWWQGARFPARAPAPEPMSPGASL